jgi:hypothetical protein
MAAWGKDKDGVCAQGKINVVFVINKKYGCGEGVWFNNNVFPCAMALISSNCGAGNCPVTPIIDPCDKGAYSFLVLAVLQARRDSAWKQIDSPLVVEMVLALAGFRLFHLGDAILLHGNRISFVNQLSTREHGLTCISTTLALGDAASDRRSMLVFIG